MELTPIYKRVIGLDVHQAKISACGSTRLVAGVFHVNLLIHEEKMQIGGT